MINKTTVILIVMISQFTINLLAQDYAKDTWIKSVTISGGLPTSSNSWEYSHPFYGETGVDRIGNETGSFKLKSIYSFNFELSKGYFGISAGAGIFPAEIKVDKNEDPYNFNSLFLEIEGVFFPLIDPNNKLIPLFKIGTGGVISSGDLDNTAIFVSFSGGLRTFLTKNIGVFLILNGRHITYDEIPLTEQITGDIKFTNCTIQLGVIYRL